MLLVGAALALYVYQDNSACGSSIGLVTQGFNQTVEQQCQQDALFFDVGVILGLMGFIVLIGGAVLTEDGPEVARSRASPQIFSQYSAPVASPLGQPVPPWAGPTPTERFCTSCGVGNFRSSAFCTRCGKPLPPPA